MTPTIMESPRYVSFLHVLFSVIDADTLDTKLQTRGHTRSHKTTHTYFNCDSMPTRRKHQSSSSVSVNSKRDRSLSGLETIVEERHGQQEQGKHSQQSETSRAPHGTIRTRCKDNTNSLFMSVASTNDADSDVVDDNTAPSFPPRSIVVQHHNGKDGVGLFRSKLQTKPHAQLCFDHHDQSVVPRVSMSDSVSRWKTPEEFPSLFENDGTSSTTSSTASPSVGTMSALTYSDTISSDGSTMIELLPVTAAKATVDVSTGMKKKKTKARQFISNAGRRQHQHPQKHQHQDVALLDSDTGDTSSLYLLSGHGDFDQSRGKSGCFGLPLNVPWRTRRSTPHRGSDAHLSDHRNKSTVNGATSVLPSCPYKAVS